MDRSPNIAPEELKPCPFCGGEASVSEGRKGEAPWWYIECFDCAATCESVDDWNRRHHDITRRD